MAKKGKKNIFIIVIVLVLVGMVLILSSNDDKKKQQKYENNDNVEIIVDENGNGLQETGNEVQEDTGVGSGISGAATVEDITGDQPNMEGQPVNTEEMLGDKDVEI